ncbi:hypothetical protein O6H91_08G111200 [Diphasiastrum complanatum]|uniref:Uncharacterized protein n=1 Tax=Diphasiastrum complanatum TaxID=34168 RepID=A0ACC2D194_DIPCM|nr:hypothetical protein O6H91_08G111200 [Diphasiastrum complanatum]
MHLCCVQQLNKHPHCTALLLSFRTGSWPQRHFPGVEADESKEDNSYLLYKPYMNYLCETLLQSAPGLRVMPLASEMKVQFSKKGSKRAQVRNWLLSSNRLRRIRMTYFDAGAAGQAFNSLLYPHYSFDLPLLGIDLLSFGSNKILCVVDFQPISQDADNLERHTQQLANIHESFAESCSRMSTRYFDENRFFSKHLIFFRSTLGGKDPCLQVPDGKFYQVYLGYVRSYFSQLHKLKANYDAEFMATVRNGQAAYDKYFAENDPAIGIFGNYFGHEWSKQCSEEFLFPESKLVSE